MPVVGYIMIMVPDGAEIKRQGTGAQGEDTRVRRTKALEL